MYIIGPLRSLHRFARLIKGIRLSFGPWNIHEGADLFGPPVRPSLDFESKLQVFKELGFDAVQFHVEYAVPGLVDLSPMQISRLAQAMHQRLSNCTT